MVRVLMAPLHRKCQQHQHAHDTGSQVQQALSLEPHQMKTSTHRSWLKIARAESNLKCCRTRRVDVSLTVIFKGCALSTSIRRGFLHIRVLILRALFETRVVGRDTGCLTGRRYIEPRPEFGFSKLVTNLTVRVLELFAMFIKLPLTDFCLIEGLGDSPLRDWRFSIRPGESIRLLSGWWQHQIPTQ
jgi:hypothetical protein